MRFFRTSRNESEKVIHLILSLLNIPHSISHLKSFLEGHPESASLLAIVDAFKSYQLNVSVIKLEEKYYEELPFPLISIHERFPFQVVDSVVNGTVKFYREDKWNYLPIKEFLRTWKGTVLLVEKTDKTQEYDLEENLKIESKQLSTNIIRIASAGLLLIISCILIFYGNVSLDSVVVLYLFVTGFAVSVALIIKDFGLKSGAFINKICSLGRGSQIDIETRCDPVLQSNLSSSFGPFKLSELSLIYFFAGFLYTIISVVTESFSVEIVMYLSAGPAFFTIITMYYQVKKLKTICGLCLITTVAIWFILMTSSYLYFFNEQTSTTQSDILVFIICGLIAVLSWSLITAQIQKGSKLGPVTRQLNYFLYNPDLLNTIIQQGRIIDTSPLPGDVVLGNKSGGIEIIVLLNIDCGYCANFFKRIIKLIYQNSEIKLVLRFISHSDDTLINFLGLLKKSSEEKIISMLHKWSVGDLKNIEEVSVTEKDKLQRTIQFTTQWVFADQVEGAPIIVINNHWVPKDIDPDRYGQFLEISKVRVDKVEVK